MQSTENIPDTERRLVNPVGHAYGARIRDLTPVVHCDKENGSSPLIKSAPDP